LGEADGHAAREYDPILKALCDHAPACPSPRPPEAPTPDPLSPLPAKRDILLVYLRFAPRRRDRSLRVVEDRT
jgi:hypothetical protein